MTVLEGLLLGIIQGLTEFLPVSSSGHLVLARNFMEIGSVPLLFDVILHVATLFVIVYHYRVKIGGLFGAAIRFVTRKSEPADSEDLQMILLVIGATILTVVVALALRMTNLDGESTRIVSLLLLITAALLASTSFVERLITPKRGYHWIQAVVTGIAQGFGTLAGISRSGITITASLWAGMSREKSGEYAFILSDPRSTRGTRSYPCRGWAGCCTGWISADCCRIHSFVFRWSCCATTSALDGETGKALVFYDLSDDSRVVRIVLRSIM